MTISYKDKITNEIKYQRNIQNTDTDGILVVNETNYCEGDCYAPIKIAVEINSDKTIVIYFYYGFGDVISSLGGLAAASAPVFNFLTPFLMLHFFFNVG